jgi:hypothetical protein
MRERLAEALVEMLDGVTGPLDDASVDAATVR